MHLSSKLEIFKPQKLPLRGLKKKVFAHTLLKAHAALDQFQKLIDHVPQPQALLASLSACEALAALESQKITQSLEDFFLLCLTHSHPEKKMLAPLYYHTALKRACRDIRSMDINRDLLCDIHYMVKKGAPRHIQPGKFRTKQNWIGPEGCKRDKAYFFPPSPKDMRFAMRNFLHECKRPVRDPLLQICILIAQLLIIHPFMDGNGRTARILIPLLIYKKGILSYPVLFLSRYLKDHRAIYFQRLFAITGKEKWEQWILFFLKGIIKQAQKEKRQTEKILQLYLTLQRRLSKRYLRMPFLFYLFCQPVFSQRHFTKRYSSGLLKELKDLRIIKRFKKGYYTFPALLLIIKNKNLEK